MFVLCLLLCSHALILSLAIQSLAQSDHSMSPVEGCDRSPHRSNDGMKRVVGLLDNVDLLLGCHVACRRHRRKRREHIISMDGDDDDTVTE
mmetsp:Transcript_28978/g.42585  ORF Transcript_28978/g.42585 Transcript_28978/m.42585 type:complete len:91 (-) Transcript_28978:170-442(-)